MNRRLGYATLFTVLIALMAGPAEAQRRSRGGQAAPQQPDQYVPQAQEKTFPLGNTWSATALNGKSVSDRRATLQVDQNLRGTGFGGCNTFSATAYPLKQQGFAMGPVALTKRACDKGATDFERSFLTALRGARNWDLANGKLIIKGAAGEVTFDRGI